MIFDFLAGERYTEEQLMTRLKVFIGVILGLTLFGIVFVVLYSLIFVTQPMNGMSPVDNKFFELIIPIATFLVGTLSGIMLAGNNPEAQMKAIEAATREPKITPPTTPTMSVGGGNSFGGSSFGDTFSSATAMVQPSFGAPPSFQPAMQPSQAMTSSRGKPMPMQGPEPEL